MTSIAVILPSRHRPDSLAAVLRALQATASTLHDITYAVSFERDDLQTMGAAFSVPGVKAFQRPKDCVPGAAFNHVVNRLPPHDIYTGFGDDVFPLTLAWDCGLVAGYEKGFASWCWQEVTDPVNASYIASNARTVKALGALCPEYFPYWFCDVWLAEIHEFAFGHRPHIIAGLAMGASNRGTTQGFRDFPFWCRVFTNTRGERIRLAVQLAAEYGVTPPDIPKAIATCHLFDQNFAGKAERFTRKYADDDEPAPYYALAKQRAEAMLAKSEAA